MFVIKPKAGEGRWSQGGRQGTVEKARGMQSAVDWSGCARKAALIPDGTGGASAFTKDRFPSPWGLRQIMYLSRTRKPRTEPKAQAMGPSLPSTGHWAGGGRRCPALWETRPDRLKKYEEQSAWGLG